MKNVLIVDGERAIRNTLKERLEYESYRVEVAANGDEAMYKIGHKSFNVVLCDMNLPDMRATELMNNFRATRFIIVSSQNDINEAISSIRNGAYDYISKPIDLNKLLSSMRALLEEQSQNHATKAAATQVELIDDDDKILVGSGANVIAVNNSKSLRNSSASEVTESYATPQVVYAPSSLGNTDVPHSFTTPEFSESSRISDASQSSEIEGDAHDHESADNAGNKVRSTPGMRRRTCVVDKIIGESIAITHVKRLIDKVGPSEARVLVTGASGTGKELVARWLHEKSHRASGPFIEVNCAAIPSELIESELFGHEKGAFTSAIKQRKGKFEQADGGTLFLDEIGDMSLSAQAKVLRALQEHKICRVGSDKDIEVNVRIVAATNKNLQHEIASAAFREDLYHRLSVIIIRLPSLRERKEDISLLVGHFIWRVCKEYNIERKRIDPDALEALIAMDWSGNIRELSNVVERLIILSGKVITLEDVNMYAVEVVEV